MLSQPIFEKAFFGVSLKNLSFHLLSDELLLSRP
jgi:hypothetical protein